MSPSGTFDIGNAGRGYGVDVIDFGAHRGDGLLLHNGTGIMLAAMDALPELRWVVDLGGVRRPVPGKLRWFLDCASQMTPVAVGALIFFADYPDAAADALFHVTCPLVVLSNVDLGAGKWVRTFDELTAAVRGSAGSKMRGDTITRDAC